MDTNVQNAYEELVRASQARHAQAYPEDCIRIQVGSATCENAAGAQEVWQEFEKSIRTSGRPRNPRAPVTRTGPSIPPNLSGRRRMIPQGAA